MIAGVLRDVRDGVRSLIRMPLLSAIVIGSLAIGIGVNTVVFSWIQARIIRPFPGVSRGASFYGVEPRTRVGGYPGGSWLEYHDLRRSLQSFSDLVAFRMLPLYVGEPGRIERTSGVLVSGNYFSNLALKPAAGRFFSASETEGGGEAVAVISHGLWQKRFNAAPSAVGSDLRINGRQVTIVGVAPQGFMGTVTGLFFDAWLPAAAAPQVLNGTTELVDRGTRGYLMMGLLRDGVTQAQAQAELDGAMRGLARDFPQSNTDVSGEVAAAWNLPRGPARLLNAGLGILQGAMLLVLLAVCGNTANLVLARASARHREMGIRLAMGAAPPRIVRLLLAETVIMSIAGAGLGAMLAMWGTNALSILPLSGLPLRFDTSIDAAGLALAIALGLAAGLMIGAAPAWQLARVDAQSAFRTAGRTAGHSRLRNMLMGAQVALALMVLIATGLSLDSYLQTRNVDPGFNRDGVWLAAYDLSGRPRDPATARAFNAALLKGVRDVPGVGAAAIASSVPLDIHGLPVRVFSVEGHTRADAGDDQASANIVTEGYFDVMGIRFVSGHDFAPLDDLSAPLQVIVNEEFVRQYFDGSEPLGRRVLARARNHVVVGVVRNSIANAFGEPPTPILYFSYRDAALFGGEIHLKLTPGSAPPIDAVRGVMQQADPEVPLFNVRTLAQQVETNLFFRRIPFQMFIVIGPLLLVLASMGIYAVVSYTSSLRKTEVGVRLAVGAVPGQIVAQFVRESLTVITIGGAIGWTLAYVAAKRYVPGAMSAPVFVAVPLLLLSVALLACWVPARGASRLDPTVALRPE